MSEGEGRNAGYLVFFFGFANNGMTKKMENTQKKKEKKMEMKATRKIQMTDIVGWK